MKKLIYFFICFLLPIALPAQQLDLTSEKIPQEASFAQPFDVHFELSHTPGYTVQLDPNSIPASFSLANEKKESLSPGAVAYDLTF